jgi:hypothetical protein
MRFNVLVLLASLCFTSSASADEASDYDKLSNIPAKYVVFGTICEYLTKIRLEDQYSPSSFDIEVGIEYRQGGRVIGEIDVVVFRKADKEAVLVGQVKCRKSMSSARGQAHEQNQRFVNTMNRNNSRIGKVTFRSTSNPALVITDTMMDEVGTYITASQDGGLLHGFTMTVGHDLDTVSAMRERLLECQEDARCPRPH